MLNRSRLSEYNALLEKYNPAEILYWLLNQNSGTVTMTSSFQAQSLPLLYLVSRIMPMLPVLFLDTGFHFKETLCYVDTLKMRLGLNIVRLASAVPTEELLYSTNPDMCCYLNKVEPLQNHLKQYDVWISGIRRDQTNTRKQMKIIDFDERNGVMKLCPMANVPGGIIEKMIVNLGLPIHPLKQQGYQSIGCEPCTQKTVNDNARSGRWGGTEKTECGLHLPEVMHKQAEGKSKT